MGKGILGRKVGMTQIYDEQGNAIPVTVIAAGPCHVLQLRTPERDGYAAVQLGFLDRPRRSASRSERGHVSRKMETKRARTRSAAGITLPPKAECEPKRFVREIRGGTDGYRVGQQIKVDHLAGIGLVDVIATSKGRGFSGVMKRHNFGGQRATHGVKKVHRQAGSTGQSAFPSRVPKGHRMPGQYGNARVTMRNLKVVKIDADNHVLVVAGSVPGPNGGLVVVQESLLQPKPSATEASSDSSQPKKKS
jgi:large subunit ribosomal protein L3